ncbi:MAG: agmatine deiminase family protein [Bacteroidales bacterium]|jgi:agmatine deiminase|nr:agmatine deiminase family protein [Bacteroidales bacterium]
MKTPKELGYFFPAEWYKHKATWLSYPHNENSWPEKINTIFPYYNCFIKAIANEEEVNIIVTNSSMKEKVEKELMLLEANMKNIHFHIFKTDDAWMRDCGPSFIINQTKKEKAIVNWQYNAWGGKYPCSNDNNIPLFVAEKENIVVFSPNIVMEGGSVDFNGKGSLITTENCLLNKNRNPQLKKEEIEEKLISYYGVENIIWLKEGIEGDDTDGHVDDITRFVNEDTIVSVIEEDKTHNNYKALKNNMDILSKARLENGKQANIVPLPMPDDVVWDDQILPASYANFYIANNIVVVPVFNCKKDNKAIYTLEECFKDRKVIGIDSTEIIWGLGSFHCLSQQEPSV